MQLKCVSIKLGLLLCVTLSCAAVAPSYRHFCPQCEEEVWEEVPCDQISKITTTTTTTTTTTASPIQLYAPTPTTPKPYATYEAPQGYALNLTDAAASHIPTTTPSTYNRCYCECKVGCKEFCRKVTLDGGSEKQITQITKTSHRVPYGNIETEHVHQQRFVADVGAAPYYPTIPEAPAGVPPVAPPAALSAPTNQNYPIESSQERSQSYAQPNLAYEGQPDVQQPPTAQFPPQFTPQLVLPLPSYSPAPHSPAPQSQAHVYPVSYPQHNPPMYENSKDTYTYPDILMDASYSVDELTRLLQIESLNKDTPITYSQPTLYTPAHHAASYSSIPTAQTSNIEAPASAPTYNPPSAPPSLPSSQPASAPTTAEQKYDHNLSISHYEPASLGDPSTPQYSNYIHKHYESAPSSAESNDQHTAYDNQIRNYRSSDAPEAHHAHSASQPSPSLDQHAAYDNQRRTYRSSDAADAYHSHPASQSIDQHTAYDNQRRGYRSSDAAAEAYHGHSVSQSSPSLDQHTAYENQGRDYRSSDAAEAYHGHPASQSSPSLGHKTAEAYHGQSALQSSTHTMSY